MRKILSTKSFLFILIFSLSGVKGFAQTNHVVISQVYGGGGNSGATYTNDFIELFNPTAATVSLAGWSVQYNNGTSTTSQWSVTNLSGSIAPGRYFLIQQSAPSSPNGAALPTPDNTGSIQIAVASGKVLLANTTAAFATQCPTGSSVMDLVGFGTASNTNCFEGALAPAGSNTTSIARTNSVCIDNNNNSTDFSTGTPSARNSSSAPFFCHATKLSVSTPADQIAGVSFSLTITARDAGNSIKNVTTNTYVTLTSNGNAGTISGTTAGTILAGTNSVTLSNVTLSSAGTGVTLTATASGGDALTATTSGTFTVNAGSITTFYSNTTGNLNQETTWGTAIDGAGTHPANFTAGNQVFHIRNNAAPTIGQNWTISGTNSKIIVGDGTNACNFTIPDGKSVSGLIELSPQSTLTNSGGSAPAFGIIAPTSTVIYNQPNAQPITAATYGNLTLGGSGSKTMGGDVTVKGTLSINSV